MKILLAAFVLVPATLDAQQRAALHRPVTIDIRSLDSSRVSDVSIDVQGRLFESAGVLRHSSGRVRCGQAGCVVTTPAVLELSAQQGAGRISVPEGGAELAVTVRQAGNPPRGMVAFGHTITFARDSAGQLVVRAPRMITRF